MTIQTKNTTITVSMPGEKNAPDALAEGEFVAYASTWTRTPDSYGDVVAKGAFSQSLKAWEKSGDPIPLLYDHNDSDPDYNIGYVKSAIEDDHGLRIVGSLDIEDNDKARQVYRLLKARRIRQMSFAYSVEEQAPVKAKDGATANELRRVNLYEVSVVPMGANQDTSIENVKHMGQRIEWKQADAIARKALDDYDSGEIRRQATDAHKRFRTEDAVRKSLGIDDIDGSYRSQLKALGGEDRLNEYRDTLADGGHLTIEQAENLRRIVTVKALQDNADEKARTMQRMLGAAPRNTTQTDYLYNPDTNEYVKRNTIMPNTKGHLDLRSFIKNAPAAAIATSQRYQEKGLVPNGQTLVEIPIVNTVPIAGDIDAEIPPRLLDYIPAIRREVPVYAIIREVTPDEPGSASVVAPGEEKPVRKLGLERVEQSLKVVAVLTEPLDKYVVQDYVNVQDWLGPRLGSIVFDAIENEIINGDGNGTHFTGLNHIQGIQSQEWNANMFDTIAAGCSKLENIGVAPTLIALNPADWLTVQTYRDAEGRYYMSNVIDPAARTMWGHQIVAVPGLAKGTGWVIGANTLTLSTDGVQTVEWDTSLGFTRNQVQARAEGRYNLDVLKPHGLVKLALTATGK
ncbi:HK97 family phage prohead protease [Bifidobacterium callimiconis]|uniref:HK97 family phage prohead protease n=1 Tax=Bifidobacterium callimiconis TaxID=2306973 RepID=UPI001BDC5ACF|nr:HK97 family phage prohead protease [Bifidobacterium callimiconis]MBT1177587.1 HK97 family phage prohead protease [Bifidobacterium callimiconis]